MDIHWKKFLTWLVVIFGILGTCWMLLLWDENRDNNFSNSLTGEEQSRIVELEGALSLIGDVYREKRPLLLFKNGRVGVVVFGTERSIRFFKSIYGTDEELHFLLHPQWIHSIERIVPPDDPEFNELAARFVRQ